MIELPYIQGYRVVIVGCGGTGGILVQNLAHYVCGSPDKRSRVGIVLMDGDTVEPRNVGRQKFTSDEVGRNKAECLAVRYQDVFGLDIGYVPEYADEPGKLIRVFGIGDEDHYTLPVLVMCVDNNFSRQVAHRVFMDDGMKDLVYIDTGNEDGRGQTVLGLK